MTAGLEGLRLDRQTNWGEDTRDLQAILDQRVRNVHRELNELPSGKYPLTDRPGVVEVVKSDDGSCHKVAHIQKYPEMARNVTAWLFGKDDQVSYFSIDIDPLEGEETFTQYDGGVITASNPESHDALSTLEELVGAAANTYHAWYPEMQED